MLTIINALRRERGMTFVVVEHNMEAVMNLCDRICVLHFGRRLAYGTPAEVADRPGRHRRLLGSGHG